MTTTDNLHPALAKAYAKTAFMQFAAAQAARFFDDAWDTLTDDSGDVPLPLDSPEATWDSMIEMAASL